MKRLRSVTFITLVAALLGSAFLFGAAGDLRAEEIKMQVWDGNSPQDGARDFLCDMSQMLPLVNKDEKIRDCTVNVVTKSEPARKLIIKAMLSSASVREQIMDTIVSNPNLKKMMESKLAAAK